MLQPVILKAATRPDVVWIVVSFLRANDSRSKEDGWSVWAVSVRSKEALVYSPGASYAHSQDHLRQVRDDRTSTLANLGTAVHGDGLLMGIDGDPSCGWLGGGAPGLSCRCSPSCSRLMRSATSTSGRTRFQLRSAILGTGWGG